MKTEEPRRTGRPPATTRERVQEAALGLFEERGYAATTMDDVAVAAGIGRTTLFRYFDAKSALVWWDFDANYERLDDALTARHGGPVSGVMAEISAAVHDALSGMPTSSQVMGRRWRLADADPSAAAELGALMMRWAARITRHVAAATGGVLDPSAADAVGYAVLGATVGASRTWADGGGATLAEELDTALAPLAEVLQEWLDRTSA